MSLRRLMKNYITILSDELVGQGINTDGALDYSKGKAVLSDFENIKCNIQEKSKVSVHVNYGKEEEDYTNVIYHQSKILKDYKPADFNNQTALWILCNKNNPFARIDFADAQRNPLDYDLFEFKGHIQQIRSKRTNLYILRAKRTYMWSI